MVRSTQTTQATGKGWKLLMLLSVFVMLIGLVPVIIGLVAIDSGVSGQCLLVGAGTVMFGVLLRTAARIGAWWCHG